MNQKYIRFLIQAIILFFLSLLTMSTQAQDNDDLLNLLIKKKVLTQHEADSLKASFKDKQRKVHYENQHGIIIGRALQISGLIQPRYQGYQQSGTSNTFDIHRARLDVKGDLTDKWSYEVYTEFAGTTKLLDAFSTYKIASFLAFTAGQFKIPYSYESLTTDSELEFIDHSQVVQALASRSKDVIGNNSGRDIGVKIAGSFFKLNGMDLFDYSFGIFNGAGINVTTDNNNHKDIAGRLGIHPISGLDIGVDFYNGIGYYGSPEKNQTRNRKGLDAHYVIGGLAITAEYNKGTDGTINRDGWYIQATYFVLPKKLQLAAKIDTYDPNKIIRTDRSTYYTGGANYYFNHWARATVDYVYRREEAKQTHNNVIEIQLQATF